MSPVAALCEAWLPFLCGSAVLFAMGLSFVRWDVGSLRSRLPLALKLKALAPLALSLILFGIGAYAAHAFWPSLSHALARSPGDADVSVRVVRGCLGHVLLAAPLYLAVDRLSRRVLRSGFDRPGRDANGDWTQTRSSEWWHVS